jgi:hypothetical protein
MVETIKEQKRSIQFKCKCGKLQWCKKGSQCHIKGMCMDCLMKEKVGIGGGEDYVPIYKPKPIRYKSRAAGRNESCICGSGLKYKHCCLPKLQAAQAEETTVRWMREKHKMDRWFKKEYKRLTHEE